MAVYYFNCRFLYFYIGIKKRHFLSHQGGWVGLGWVDGVLYRGNSVVDIWDKYIKDIMDIYGEDMGQVGGKERGGGSKTTLNCRFWIC